MISCLPCMCVCVRGGVLSHFSQVPFFATLWTVAHQAPLSMGFSRQEHWSGLPLPPAGDLPNPETEHTSPESPALAERFFTTELPNPPPKCFLKNILNIPKKFLFSFIENWRKFLSPGGNLKNKFYWSLVDLQCYVSFRYTAKWISYTYTYIHSYFRFFPVPSIIEFWVELPVPLIRLNDFSISFNSW